MLRALCPAAGARVGVHAHAASWRAALRRAVHTAADANANATPSASPPRHQTVRELLATAVEGQRVCTGGWVRSARRQKAHLFVELHDGSCAAVLQLVLPLSRPAAAAASATPDAEADSSLDPEAVALARSLSTGASVRVVGHLTPLRAASQPAAPTASALALLPPGSPAATAASKAAWLRSSGRAVELEASSLQLVGAAVGFPLQKQRLAPGTQQQQQQQQPSTPQQQQRAQQLRTEATMHLRMRGGAQGAMARVRDEAAAALTAALRRRGFSWLPAPALTSNDCEGAGHVFRVVADHDLVAYHRRVASMLSPPREPLPPSSDANGASDIPSSAEPPPPSASASTADADADTDTTPAPASSHAPRMREFFGKPTYLTVSGQLHAETYALALSRVFTFGPTFRAEASSTRTHLAEFWMLEPEMAFAALDDAMLLAEQLLCDTIESVLEHCAQDLLMCQERLDPSHAVLARLLSCVEQARQRQHRVGHCFPRLSYQQAIERLNQLPDLPRLSFGDDLSKQHELALTERCFYGPDAEPATASSPTPTPTPTPVFVTHFPKEHKAFYTKHSSHDPRVTESFDLLVPGVGELVGGTAREDDLHELERRLKAMDSARALRWYADLRRWGSVPHAGFGLGFERLLLFLTGAPNIRDTSAFPRSYGSCLL